MQDIGVTVATSISRSRNVDMGFLKKYFLVIVCAFVSALSFVNPLVKFLQFLMSITVISKFTSNQGTHENTPACDIATNPGNLDYFLAKVSSFLAWSLLLPVLYMIARVVVPAGDVEDLGMQAAAIADKHYAEEIERTKSDWSGNSLISDSQVSSIEYLGRTCPEDIATQ